MRTCWTHHSLAVSWRCSVSCVYNVFTVLQVEDESEDLLDTPQPGSLLEVLSILRNLVENITKRQQSGVSPGPFSFYFRLRCDRAERPCGDPLHSESSESATDFHLGHQQVEAAQSGG